VNAENFLDPLVAAERLARGTMVFAALFERLPDAFVRRRPAPERWSLLEIVGHLADEEVFDFRARVESTLRDPKAPWPSISPQDWVLERRYNEQDPAAAWQRFRDERAHSVRWIASQSRAAWTNAYVHPKLGALSARKLLANWLAHDLLHARQMLRIHHDALAANAAPDTLDYAGPW
jgi:hypothetical protein